MVFPRVCQVVDVSCLLERVLQAQCRDVYPKAWNNLSQGMLYGIIPC